MTPEPLSKRPSLARLWLGVSAPPFGLEVAIAAIQVVGTVLASQGQPSRESVDALAVVLLLAGPAALIARHRYPAGVAFAVSGIALVYMLLGYPYGPVLLSVIVALFTAIASGHRQAAWLSGMAVYGIHFGARFLFDIDSTPTTEQLLLVAAWLLVVLAGSELIRARRDWAAKTELAREEESRRLASERRLRIARELHDVLAHNISLINVQAGVALHLMDRQPEQARTALTAIEGASREALSELRSVLSILQRPDEDAPRSPAVGLDRLEGLVQQTQAAGLNVQTRIEGKPLPLPASVDAAAFRIVQEALTNVVRHAGAARATVSVSFGEREVAVQIEDDGNGSREGNLSGGRGIAGMRERVAALNGQFRAGPLPGRGFRVRAQLPLDASQ